MNESEKPRKASAPIIKRIGGYLHRVVPIVDSTGKVISNIVTPFQVELKPRDLFQMVVGAYLLAVPVAFTEEVWVLSEELPFKNVLMISGISILFIACFVYYNFYRNVFKAHWFECVKRVISTYMVSLLAVGLFLTIITKCPWETDALLAIKRIILVTFPASMSATLSDTIK